MNKEDVGVCAQLLELIDSQSTTINIQNKIIAKLANENFEQENFIRELMREHTCEAEDIE